MAKAAAIAKTQDELFDSHSHSFLTLTEKKDPNLPLSSKRMGATTQAMDAMLTDRGRLIALCLSEWNVIQRVRELTGEAAVPAETAHELDKREYKALSRLQILLDTQGSWNDHVPGYLGFTTASPESEPVPAKVKRVTKLPLAMILGTMVTYPSLALVMAHASDRFAPALWIGGFVISSAMMVATISSVVYVLSVEQNVARRVQYWKHFTAHGYETFWRAFVAESKAQGFEVDERPPRLDQWLRETAEAFPLSFCRAALTVPTKAEHK